MLSATEIKAVFYKDKFNYSNSLIAWGPRVQMIALIAEMKGLIKEEQENAPPGVKVVIIDAKNRPPRPQQPQQ